MVRCGGCGNAFNSLSFLSESMPKQATANHSDSPVPELTPEIIETDRGVLKAISAEQSAALLKTLDELAGSDIRIEDTGVEWRVLDDDVPKPAANSGHAGVFNPLESSEPLDINEPLSNDEPLSIDELLEASETPIDQFLTKTPDVIDAPEVFEEAANGFGKTSVDELRFDDNTPLPDDFDLDDESSYVAPAAPEAPPAKAQSVQQVEPQAELDLSEPNEWSDILDEFEDLSPVFAAPTDEPAAVDVSIDEDQLVQETVDENPLDEEFPEEVVAVAELDNAEGDLLDMDTQFALQAEAMGIDISGIHKVDDDLAEELADVVEELLDDEVDEEADEVEDEIEEEIGIEEDAELEEETGDGLEDEVDDEVEEDIEFETVLEEQVEPVIEAHTIEDELELLNVELPTVEDSPDDHFVPAMTEEEHTVNMQIDQDLMALAIEDEDGFASTIIIPKEDAEIKAREELTDELDDLNEAIDDEDSGFETIIMEGETIHSTLDMKKLAADSAEAAQLLELAKIEEAKSAAQLGNKRYGMIGGAVVLVFLLIFQIMHQSREALATIPAFNGTVGQIYRALGQPVQPAWDITGWRFEATKGNTDGDDGEELTVYSRIGNKSESSMPYPLIGVSLTDRFEETIGSRILDPAEYLPTDLDPGKLVEPGNTFEAVITIDSALEDATGFRLKVCYRLSDGQLRCAIDDFK